MADPAAATAASLEVTLSLTETDRFLIDRLRNGIIERAAIKRVRAEPRSQSPSDTKRARLERNQQQLGVLLEDLLTTPSVSTALKEIGRDAETMRAGAERRTWARDVAPALSALQLRVEQDQERQRQASIGEAARAMIELGLDPRRGATETWLNDLEARVRASLGRGEAQQGEVGERLVSWAEEAIRAVPEPVAATARAELAQHLHEIGIDAVEAPSPEQARAPASHQSTADPQRSRRAETNRVSAGEGIDPRPSERQVEDFVEVVRPASVPEPGLLSRWRDYWSGRRGPEPSAEQQAGDEGISEALRRRYAVHVSDNRKTIELFEAGAKTAAITLDAHSISTPHNEGTVVTDIVALARDRGWQTLKIVGTPEFKDAVWLEASKAGLIARHEPSGAIKAAFDKWDRERPANTIQQAAPPGEPVAPTRPGDDLAQAFASKSAEQRLADPRLRNAQLELMIGMRTAERELERPIAEMPEVAQALTAAVREQLAQGRMFDAPFVKPSQPKPTARLAANPTIDADRIAPPRR